MILSGENYLLRLAIFHACCKENHHPLLFAKYCSTCPVQISQFLEVDKSTTWETMKGKGSLSLVLSSESKVWTLGSYCLWS